MQDVIVKTALEQLRPVLELLADGEIHSGESLGVALGVSRAAVWKQLQKLEQYGLTLESMKGRGYRLLGGLDLLSAEAIRSQLDDSAQGLLKELLVFDEVGSTNSLLLEQMEEGRGHAVAVLAERQSAGRGRRGRNWISPYGSSISLSVGWEFSGGVQGLEGLSLAVGVAVAGALQRFSVPGVRLKWPNDIWCQGRKLAGVLLELKGDLTDRCSVVIGIGLNSGLCAKTAGEIDQPWADLQEVSPGVTRNELAAAILSELLALLASYSQRGFEFYRDAWLALDQFSGQPVRLQSGSLSWTGTAAGVDESGALVLNMEDGQKSFHGGEISLRGAV
ncbi:bifunctional biotin--[acetyl-CoA-carboxylase] ligase/biotin operon repressor BirA [Microbulbifer okhotskensis]|uniref:bifunctional biotin--[acetyl-CoA-carboxylase] ligase/biotin operon repressor BirA n=1 Tax=Microbulbifer okhotskensis TaxID=2926617 RepID=UPI002811567D|nr:bifunctional biotin--[acetyl-CoA-carboxylase] ligase/biotin operon repressor BirA [Microbulbifer okhotskensis]